MSSIRQSRLGSRSAAVTTSAAARRQSRSRSSQLPCAFDRVTVENKEFIRETECYGTPDGFMASGCRARMLAFMPPLVIWGMSGKTKEGTMSREQSLRNGASLMVLGALIFLVYAVVFL